MLDLDSKWVRFGPNGTNSVLFRSDFTTLWLIEQKWTEIWSLKIPSMSYLVQIWHPYSIRMLVTITSESSSTVQFLAHLALQELSAHSDQHIHSVSDDLLEDRALLSHVVWVLHRRSLPSRKQWYYGEETVLFMSSSSPSYRIIQFTNKSFKLSALHSYRSRSIYVLCCHSRERCFIVCLGWPWGHI